MIDTYIEFVPNLQNFNGIPKRSSYSIVIYKVFQNRNFAKKKYYKRENLTEKFVLNIPKDLQNGEFSQMTILKITKNCYKLYLLMIIFIHIYNQKLK